jgi:hypothetical protein
MHHSLSIIHNSGFREVKKAMMDLPSGIAPQAPHIHPQNNRYTFHLFVDAHNQVVCDIFCILKPLITALPFIHL